MWIRPPLSRSPLCSHPTYLREIQAQSHWTSRAYQLPLLCEPICLAWGVDYEEEFWGIIVGLWQGTGYEFKGGILFTIPHF